MSLLRRAVKNLTVIGLGFLALCPMALAQAVFDDAEADGAQPKPQWRQKVLHSNKAAQETGRYSTQNAERRPTQPTPFQEDEEPVYRSSQRSMAAVSSREDIRHTAQRPAYRTTEQGTKYRVAEGSAYQSADPRAAPRVTERPTSQYSGRARPGGVYPTSYSQPGNMRVAQREIQPQAEVEPGMTQYEPLGTEGVFAPQDGGCAYGGGGCGDCGACGDCGDCDACGASCCPWVCGWGPRVLSIFAGVHGFKGPRDRGVNGNFGFQEGVNFGAPLGDPWGCGYQLGFQALQSDISGAGSTAIQSADSTVTLAPVTADRHQYFFTAGIFRRAECAGWQWGVVFDLLHDTYIQDADLKQIRTETGYLFNECNEIGYSGAYGVGGDSVDGTYFGRTIDGQLDPTDQFVIYFRRYFENGGDGRIWGGVTGHGDGLLGADAWIPLGSSWALQNSFNYLIPKGSRGTRFNENTGQLEGAQVREAWSVAFNLVWYPGRSSRCIDKSCYRPLLNVADNSLFMVRESTNISRTTDAVTPGAL